jgi:membrane associated rhomboid family serine protease
MQQTLDSADVTGRAGPSESRPPSLLGRLTVGHLRDRLRDRFLWGLPWGTLLLMCLLVGGYLLLQDGLGPSSRPLTIPFTSWSYWHPTGILLGPVAHSGSSHLLANLAGLLVFGSIAEYVYGHKLPRVGGGSPRPAVRALVVVPAAALLAGVLASAFSWGPTLGFSNVVFAFAGVVLVRYPLGTVVALSAREALVLLAEAIEAPLSVAGRSALADPWFIDTAVQSHAFGLLLGILVGVALLVVRDADPPSPSRLWVGVALFAVVASLWVIWWPTGSAYVLARGPGLLLVVTLATVITAGAVLALRGGGPFPDDRARKLGFAALIVPLLAMAAVAVPLNATVDATTPSGTETVEVRGYSLTYAEDVPNQRLAPFTAVTGEPATTSGVIVVDPKRGIWTRAIPADRLATERRVTLRLGGLGWDRTVFAVRRGWRTAGGETAYQVWLNPRDGRVERVHASIPARSAAIIEGYNVTLVPSGLRFRLRVTRGNQTVGTAPVPDPGDNVTFDSLTLKHTGDRLLAVTNRSRVQVASRR